MAQEGGRSLRDQAEALPFAAPEVRSVERPTRAEFQRLVQGGEPIILRGCLEHWPLYQRFAELADPGRQLDHLASLLPRKKVQFTRAAASQQGKFRLDGELKQNFSFDTGQELFPEFARQAKAALASPSESTLYMQSLPLPELVKGLGALDLFEGWKPTGAPGYWIGTGGQKVATHNDEYRNALSVVAGMKRVTLFAPQQLPDLYLAPIDRRLGRVLTSLADPLKPDFERFPRFSKALGEARVAVLRAGDMLYMPPLWWHHVESFGFNVGINCWFEDGPEAAGLYAFGVPLMLALQHAPLEERQRLRLRFVEAVINGVMGGGSALDKQVLAAAHKVRRVLVGLTTDVAARWRGWVLEWMDWCVFRVAGDPFPTLPGEFDRMLGRFAARGPLRRTIGRLRGTAERFQQRLALRGEHGIVP